MQEHATDLLGFSFWVITSLGGIIVALLAGFIALARWGGVQILQHLAKQDTTIERFGDRFSEQIAHLECAIQSEMRSLSDLLHDHEARLRVVEERCRLEHGYTGPLRRRTDHLPG